MPRSFLVKKPSSTRIPNYGQLDTRGKATRFCLHRGPPGPPDPAGSWCLAVARGSPAGLRAPCILPGTRSPGTPLKDTQTLNLPPRRRSFSCRHCARLYASLRALKMHIRTHTLPCLCRLCGKAFSRPWLLQGHIRTHTGEKPFACPHCSRAFADRSNLRAHLQTHSDVKKYRCRACARTFSRMALLARHEEGGCCGAS
ncbi:zinc finger protein SNAI3 [Pelecanus crispus]|uniref:zinc finger protein SNAI3 n=1 Tax=Pelecanus crispus TaxID=36300 RepID=UPI003F5D2F6F